MNSTKGEFVPVLFIAGASAPRKVNETYWVLKKYLGKEEGMGEGGKR